MVVYGTEGIGKTTLASKFPNPLFIDVENGSKELDVARVDESLNTWNNLLDVLNEIDKDPTICRTVVIDTVDAAELLLMRYLEQKHHTNNVEALDYGKGTIYIRDEMTKLLNILDSINDKGCNVVLLAHSTIRKFEKPDETGAYDRYELKLTRKNAPLIKEWCDCLLFTNYETTVISPSNKMEKKKITGGKRMIYTSHHPAWDAKNRYGLPEKLPLEYDSIKQVFEFDNNKVEINSKEVEEAQAEPSVRVTSDNQVEVHDEKGNVLNDPDFKEIPRNLPTDLAVLMEKDGITENMIIQAVASKGLIEEFNETENRASRIDDIDSKFIKENIVGQWDNFKKFAQRFAA